MSLLLRAAYRVVYRARRICIHLACCALGAGAPHAAVSLDRGAKFLDELRTREHSDEPTWAYHGGLPAAGSCAADSPALKGFDFSRKEEARQRRPRAQCLLSLCALSSVLHLVFHLGHGLFYAAIRVDCCCHLRRIGVSRKQQAAALHAADDNAQPKSDAIRAAS